MDKAKNIILSFDIETRGLGGAACYVSWCAGEKAQGIELSGDSELTNFFMDYVLTPANNGCIIVAHYGMRFDYLRLLWGKIADEGYIGRFFCGKNENNIVGIDLKKSGNTWKLRDSYNYFPGTLAEFVSLFAKEHKKGVIDFSKVMFNPKNKKHVEYALNDAKILHAAFISYNTMLEEWFNVSVTETITLSGASYKSMKRLSKDKGYSDMERLIPSLESKVRSSYHGGMTCGWKVGEFKNIVYYDINSAYAHVMEKYLMPHGSCIVSTSKPLNDENCLIFAVVYIGDEFPFLISRPDDKSTYGRYAGKICGWFWGFELARQEKLGSVVFKFIWMIWLCGDDRQKHFVAKCRKLRNTDYNGPLGLLAKRVQNSCYGKHGAAVKDYDVVLSADKPLKGTCIINAKGDPVQSLWYVPSNAPDRTMVHWASYVTARARVILLDYLLRVPRNEWIYCDTDSFMVPVKYQKIFKNDCGVEYGKLKCVGIFSNVEIRAPKTYRVRKSNEPWRITAKGIPAKRAPVAWINGEAIFDASMSLGLVLKGRHLEGSSYIHRVTRALSSPTTVTQGHYIHGLWTANRCCGSVFDLDDIVSPSLLTRISRCLNE